MEGFQQDISQIVIFIVIKSPFGETIKTESPAHKNQPRRNCIQVLSTSPKSVVLMFCLVNLTKMLKDIGFDGNCFFKRGNVKLSR